MLRLRRLQANDARPRSPRGVVLVLPAGPIEAVDLAPDPAPASIPPTLSPLRVVRSGKSSSRFILLSLIEYLRGRHEGRSARAPCLLLRRPRCHRAFAHQ